MCHWLHLCQHLDGSVAQVSDVCNEFLNIFAKFFKLIFKYFRKKWQKIGVFTQNKAKLCKNLIMTLVFEKNANFMAEKFQKSPKIVIITSTPRCPTRSGTHSRTRSSRRWPPTSPRCASIRRAGGPIQVRNKGQGPILVRQGDQMILWKNRPNVAQPTFFNINTCSTYSCIYNYNTRSIEGKDYFFIS
jgi:hypothetical protein